MACLYALGFAMTLLCVMGFTSSMLLCAGIILAVTAACTAASLNKWTSVAFGILTAVGCCAWLFMADGSAVFTDIVRAAALHVSGLTTALPLFERETVVLVSIASALLAQPLTHRSTGGYPALLVLLLSAVLLWLGDVPLAMVYMLPAVIATVTLMVYANHVILPLRRILPTATVIVLLSYALVPSAGVTVAPLKNAADTLRQRIFDYLFFTEARNVFTLATEGYYPQGQHQLGGPASPDDSPVMMVSTPKTVYLRGAVKDEYTGRTWVDTLAGRRHLWVSPRWQRERTAAFNMDLPQGALGANEGLMSVESVSVRIMDVSASSLFVPQRIRELQPGGDLVPYFNVSSEVFATRDLQPGDTYTVLAPLMVGGEAGLGTLVTACAGTEDPAWASILQTYTKLPAHLQQELYDLAAEITAEAVTPYDKAYALRTYLSRSFRYALDVEMLPANVDFVSYFLLKGKEGYCTYFASAMTVLCRMAGLPARYVEGYLAQPGDNGVAYVTGLNGHAWTEVYFEGFGWLTFDATPILGSQNSGQTFETPEEMEEPESTPPPPQEPEETEDPGEPTPSPEPESEPSPEPEEAPEDTPEDHTGDLPQRSAPPLWWLWLLLLALMIAAAVRIVLTQPRRMASRAADEMTRWSIWMQATHDCLNTMKLPRKKSESPIAYMRRLDSLRRLSAQLTPLGECEALVFYGRTAPEPEETLMAAAAYGQLTAAMTWQQKLHLLLTRAFVPLKKRDFTR